MTSQQLQPTEKIIASPTDQTNSNPTLVHHDSPMCLISNLNVPGAVAQALKIQMGILSGLERGENVLKIMHDGIKAIVEKAGCQGGTWYKVVENRIVRKCMTHTGSGEHSWETACAQTAELQIGGSSIIGYILGRVSTHDAQEIIRFGNLALWSDRLDNCPADVTGNINTMRTTGLLMHSSCIVAVCEGEKVKYALQLFRQVKTEEELVNIDKDLFSEEDRELIIQLIANIYLPLVLLEHMQIDLVHHKPLHPQNGTGSPRATPVPANDNQQITTDEALEAMSLSVELYAAGQEKDVSKFTSILKGLVQSFQK